MTGPRYMDVAATAPLRTEARDALLRVFDGEQANPSSVHGPGQRAKGVLEGARVAIATALGATPAEVVFTSGGTEANNLAVVGLALANPRGRHVVTSPIEHPSVLESCRFLERVFGFEISMAAVTGDGVVDPAAVAAVMRDDTALVSIGIANGELGTVQPIAGIARVARERGALMHTDAVQAAASLPVSFGAAGAGWPGTEVDAMSVASHKFGGPQGVGALLVRRHLPLEPLLHGGGQEGGARSGTQNVAGIAGFAAAVTAVSATVGHRALALVRARDELVERVLAEVPGSSLTGHAAERLPGHASFVVAGTSGESVLVALEASGFAVSSGSACAAGEDEPSAALLAVGLDPDLARTAIRFTLSDVLGDGELSRIIEVMRAETRAGRRAGS